MQTILDLLEDQVRADTMGPLYNYEHLIKLRNARVALGIPLSYGVGTNGAVAKVNKEKIQRRHNYIVFEEQVTRRSV